MFSLSVAIQLAPWMQERVRNVAQVKDQLLAEGLGPADITIYPDQHRDPMRAFIGTLSALGESEGLVMEDDVVLCQNFLERVQEAVNLAPDTLPLQFFSLKPTDIERGTGTRAPSSFLGNLCVYYPPGMAADLVAYYEKTPLWKDGHPEHPTGTDLLVRDYLVTTKTPYVQIMPNLVDHQRFESAINTRRSKSRQSVQFANRPGAN